MAGILVFSIVAGRRISRTGRLKPFLVTGAVSLAAGFAGLGLLAHQVADRTAAGVPAPAAYGPPPGTSPPSPPASRCWACSRRSCSSRLCAPAWTCPPR
ncbi:hypothetical protein [Amycolatopsis sp. cmx-8-4]|uniref:hypothetical protein n=1 Tax=Amycolatopsis sp. cmx-8-4 TaxID=2790947 RepID=UPI00397B8C73